MRFAISEHPKIITATKNPRPCQIIIKCSVSLASSLTMAVP
jgi:hypothetical protein